MSIALRRSLPALVGGLCMALAPAPLNWWGCAWVGLIPLWWVVFPAPTARHPEPTVKLTWLQTQLPLILWSLAYHGLALRWITGLHPLTWMGIPWLGSVAIVAFAWSFITFWGVGSVLLWGAGLRWLNQRSPLGTIERVLAGTALWCTIEAARSLTPLDWTTLAYTQSPGNPWILHLGQLSGNLTVSAAIVAVNGLLAEALRPDQPKLPTKGQRQFLGAALALGLTSHAIGAILYFQPLNDATAEALNVGIIQGNVPTRIKLSADGIQQAIRNYTIGYRDLAQQGVDAVLTPEGALPFDWASQQPPLLVGAITQAKVPLWLGSFGTARDATGQRRPAQRLFSLNDDGAIISHYDKVKLVPLGESLPFESVLGNVIGRLSPLRSYLFPGEIGQTFETGFGRAAIGICYESAFPNLFQAQIQQGANLIITASNLDPYSEVLMAQHQAHDLMRAIEFDRWTIRATNTGYSGIINPHGQILWQSPARQFVTHSGQIYRRRTQTLYSRAGNWLTPLLVVALGVVWRFRIQRP